MCEDAVETLNERERTRLRRYERLWRVLLNVMHLDDSALAVVVRDEITTEICYIMREKGKNNVSSK